MSLCFSRRRVWGDLFPAVLAREAEGEFAAVDSGDGEKIDGWGAIGEVEGVAVGTCGGEFHLFAAALHVGEPRGDHAVVRLQTGTAHLHVVALVVGEAAGLRLGEGCTGAGVEHHVHVSAVAWAWLVVRQWGCGWYLGEVEGHPAAGGVGVGLGLSVGADGGDAYVAHGEETLHRLGGEVLVVAILCGGEPCVALVEQVEPVALDVGDGAVATRVDDRQSTGGCGGERHGTVSQGKHQILPPINRLLLPVRRMHIRPRKSGVYVLGDKCLTISIIVRSDVAKRNILIHTSC